MKRKLYPLLQQHGASRRLLNTLWKFDKTFTIGRDITLRQLIRDWSRSQMERELFGFGAAMRHELATVLSQISLPPDDAYQVRLWLDHLQKETLGPVATTKRLVALIEELRTGLAESVTIYQPNDDFGGPAEAVCINGEWTGFEDRHFSGDTLLEALTNATKAKRAATNPPPTQS